MLLWLILLTILIYFLFYQPLTYWRRNNFPYASPLPLFGNFLNFLLGSESFFENFKRIYNEYSYEKVIGIYLFQIPVLMINDLEIIRDIFIKNSDIFLNRTSLGFDLSYEPILSRNIANIEDEKWRKVRSALSPTFTKAKMQYMYNTIYKCGENLAEFMNSLFEVNSLIVELNLKETFGKYTIDSIVTTLYGVEINSLQNPNNLFYLNSKKATQLSAWRFILRRTPFQKILNIPPVSMKHAQFYLDVFRENLRERREKNIERPDMMNLLLEAQNKSKEKALIDKNEIELTDDDIIAQAFVFFFGGYDTTSSALTFCIYELALNPDCQQKLYEEIKEIKNTDQISFDQLMNLKYMDMVISESLRKWPQGAILDRKCNKSFQLNIDGKGMIIKKGTAVLISTMGMAHDPKYFLHPEKFDPERFNEENLKTVDSSILFSFGIGPRQCIGMRFAIMLMKIALFSIIKDYEFIPTKNTEIPIKISTETVFMKPNTSIIGIKKRI